MTDAGTPNDPLADIFTMFAAPIAGALRTVEQFRKGVDEFLRGVENFNTTMENLNATTARINALLEDLEEPLRAAVPQITRTVRAADEMTQVLIGPAKAVAPGLNRLATTLSTPAFEQLPHQLEQFNGVLSELSKRLAPLTQLAGSAGGLFGLRFPGAQSEPAEEPEPEPTLATRRAASRSSSPAKKSTTKRATKKSSAKTRPS